MRKWVVILGLVTALGVVSVAMGARLPNGAFVIFHSHKVGPVCAD